MKNQQGTSGGSSCVLLCLGRFRLTGRPRKKGAAQKCRGRCCWAQKMRHRCTSRRISAAKNSGGGTLWFGYRFLMRPLSALDRLFVLELVKRADHLFQRGYIIGNYNVSLVFFLLCLPPTRWGNVKKPCLFLDTCPRRCIISGNIWKTVSSEKKSMEHNQCYCWVWHWEIGLPSLFVILAQWWLKSIFSCYSNERQDFWFVTQVKYSLLC